MQWIDDAKGLAAACRSLEGASVVYVDTEFESSKNEKLLSLIQLSTGGEPWVLDALRLQDLAELRAVLARPELTWVLHAGQHDVELLTASLRMREPPRLFDTQVAWALLSPEYSVSLAYLEYTLLRVRRGKGYQTDDWKRRPLPKAQIEYAAADIEHLPALALELRRRAGAKNREAIIESASLELLSPAPEPPATLSLASFRNAWQLAPENQAALRAMIRWHNELDTYAKSRAPEGKALLSIASRLPETAKDLLGIKGVPYRFPDDQAKLLVERIQAARASMQAGDFTAIEPEPYATFREIRTDAWLGWVRAELAHELEVAPELVLPARLLKRMRAEMLLHGDARRAQTCLSGWRQDLLFAPLEHWCQTLPLDLGP